MFNPLVPYHVKYLSGFRQKGVCAFVLQSYPRGCNRLQSAPPMALLLTPYADPKQAEDHFGVIAPDVNRRLLLPDREADASALLAMGGPEPVNPVFLPFKVADAEQRARKALDKKLRAYILYRLQWRVSGQHTIQFSLDVIFGEIYAVLRHGGLTHTVKLDDIENTSGYVL